MLYPMFAMVILTYVVLIINFVWRINSVKKRTVHPRYYKLMEGEDVPRHIVAGGRHFSNMLELPVLFYAVGVLAIVLNMEGWLMLGSAWLFVLARIAHAYIHMTYNNVIHRLVAFQIGAWVLLFMWIMLVFGR